MNKLFTHYNSCVYDGCVLLPVMVCLNDSVYCLFLLFND